MSKYYSVESESVIILELVSLYAIDIVRQNKSGDLAHKSLHQKKIDLKGLISLLAWQVLLVRTKNSTLVADSQCYCHDCKSENCWLNVNL